MIFHRTPHGLSNMTLFLSGIDAIVFVEGGDSFSLEDVQAGKYGSESQDIAFWRRCFDDLGPELELQFRAVGGKDTLYGIALLVAGGVVSNVYVAMDRDFDNLLGRTISSPKVIYTFGYSWENDVWHESVIEDTFYTLCGVDRTAIKDQVGDILHKHLKKFDSNVRWAVKADFLCVKHAIRLLPRKSPFKVITQGTETSGPVIDRKALLKSMRDAKAAKTCRVAAGSKIRLEPRIDCCGHVIGAFGYSLLSHLFRKFSKSTKVPRNVVDSIVVDKFFQRISRGHFEGLRKYYQQQLAA